MEKNLPSELLDMKNIAENTMEKWYRFGKS